MKIFLKFDLSINEEIGASDQFTLEDKLTIKKVCRQIVENRELIPDSVILDNLPFKILISSYYLSNLDNIIAITQVVPEKMGGRTTLTFLTFKFSAQKVSPYEICKLIVSGLLKNKTDQAIKEKLFFIDISETANYVFSKDSNDNNLRKIYISQVISKPPKSYQPFITFLPSDNFLNKKIIDTEKDHLTHELAEEFVIDKQPLNENKFAETPYATSNRISKKLPYILGIIILIVLIYLSINHVYLSKNNQIRKKITDTIENIDTTKYWICHKTIIASNGETYINFFNIEETTYKSNNDQQVFTYQETKEMNLRESPSINTSILKRLYKGTNYIILDNIPSDTYVKKLKNSDKNIELKDIWLKIQLVNLDAQK